AFGFSAPACCCRTVLLHRSSSTHSQIHNIHGFDARFASLPKRKVRMKKIAFVATILLLFVCVVPVFAQATPPAPAAVDSGDTSFVLISAALVLLMTIPGLFLFYGGMVRSKNVLGVLMQSFILAALISVQWVVWGYSVAFGPGGFLIGGFQWFGLNGVGLDPNPDYSATIPHQAFMVFHMMFAVITPALMTGAFAERLKFKTFIVFSLLWASFIYDPLAHWVWGVGGWLRNLGALDFAGGTVVHISSG